MNVNPWGSRLRANRAWVETLIASDT